MQQGGNLFAELEAILNDIRHVSGGNYSRFDRELRIDLIKKKIINLIPEERLMWEKLSHTKSSEGNSILDQDYDPLSLNENFYFR